MKGSTCAHNNCNEAAKFVCSRCNVEKYCSKKCQISAFSQHRYLCFNLPLLNLIDQDENKLKGSEEQELVALSVSCEINDNDGKTTETTIAPLKETRKTDNKQKDLITPAFDQGPRTVPPKEYQDRTTTVSSTKKIVENPTVEEKPIVEKKVFTMDTMRRNNQTQLSNSQIRKPKESRIYRRELHVRPLKKGKNKVKLVNCDDQTKIFFVMEANDNVTGFLSYIESNINDCIENYVSKSYKPVKDEVVLAEFDGVYYRAVIDNIIDNDPKNIIYDVFFIDYGNSSQVTENQMKPISSKLKNEIVINPVSLENFPTNMSNKQAEILGSDDGFYINVTDQSEDCYFAEILGI